MQTYIGFLRGVNVGGKSLISMAALRDALSACGFDDVRTYIQSGNVIFNSSKTNTDAHAASISKCIKDSFGHSVSAAVFSADDWRDIVATAPKWWGKDADWKHNILVLIKPFDMQQVIADIGKIKPEIEKLHAGNGVLYQSISWKYFGRSTSGKLAGKPVYKQMTVRNYNTATKLVGLL